MLHQPKSRLAGSLTRLFLPLNRTCAVSISRQSSLLTPSFATKVCVGFNVQSFMPSVCRWSAAFECEVERNRMSGERVWLSLS